MASGWFGRVWSLRGSFAVMAGEMLVMRSVGNSLPSTRTNGARRSDCMERKKDDDRHVAIIMDVDDKRFLPAKRKAPKKQKRRVVSSDEGEDVVIDSDDEPEADEDDEDDEDDDVSATKRRPSAKAKPAASSRAKAKSAKGKGDTVKDEPRLAPASRASSVAANDEAASALAAQSSADTAPARPTTDKDPADPLVPKKRKLPTIKKNKPPGTAGPSTAAKPSPLPPSTDDLKPSVPTILQRKTATALSGAQDLDLSNQQVYASLFKGVRLTCTTPVTPLTRTAEQ